MSSAARPAPGQVPTNAMLTNIPRLITDYFALTPDMEVAAQRVAFGTSGHRGSAFNASFNESHILAIAQAVCLWRKQAGTDGPLFLGIDTHALSEPAFVTALEVFAANGVDTMIDAGGYYTPTPVISHAILTYNRGRSSGLADGVVISPSHNPPEDGGFKYNPPNGGPADTNVTGWIEAKANDLLSLGLDGVHRVALARAREAGCVHKHDYRGTYVADLENVVDMAAIRASGVKIGIDPLGGAAVQYWAPIIDRYKINATVVNADIDPTFRFMTADWDGKIRMDCSSPFAMKKLIGLATDFDVAFANDTDADRHGIVCRGSGLMNPNFYLASAISYLLTHRPDWPAAAAIGKTIVSSAMIDRIVAKCGRQLMEVPVGFKWFSQGLIDGGLAFGGEESAGAAFLRRDGSVWTTDKDGLIMGLLAAEITAKLGHDPQQAYIKATEDLGQAFYARVDAPASAAQKAALKSVTAADITAKQLAGDPISGVATTASGNGASIGGIKVATEQGWFAARPSGTEDVYKIYAESFRSAAHLADIQAQAKDIVGRLAT